MEQDIFRDKVRQYCKLAGFSLKGLARELGLHPSALSQKLNGTNKAVLLNNEVKQIIVILANWNAINWRSQALELLYLAGLPDSTFTSREWQKPPLSSLDTVRAPEEILSSRSATSRKSLQPSQPEPEAKPPDDFHQNDAAQRLVEEPGRISDLTPQTLNGEPVTQSAEVTVSPLPVEPLDEPVYRDASNIEYGLTVEVIGLLSHFELGLPDLTQPFKLKKMPYGITAPILRKATLAILITLASFIVTQSLVNVTDQAKSDALSTAITPHVTVLATPVSPANPSHTASSLTGYPLFNYSTIKLRKIQDLKKIAEQQINLVNPTLLPVLKRVESYISQEDPELLKAYYKQEFFSAGWVDVTQLALVVSGFRDIVTQLNAQGGFVLVCEKGTLGLAVTVTPGTVAKGYYSEISSSEYLVTLLYLTTFETSSSS